MTEVCPRCGEFVNRLDSFYGWCDFCVEQVNPRPAPVVALDGVTVRCPECGQERVISRSHAYKTGSKTICRSCNARRASERRWAA